MEKSIQKWSVYGFFISLGLSVLFVDYKVNFHFDGGYTTEYVPVYDYIVTILRYSVIGALVGMFVGWALTNNKVVTALKKQFKND
ncbi:hypothetical protein MHH85_06230 [Viridibacillus sp. FSL E2-0187]|uniref:hypothetical protein n=1 Tax=Viridibacillus TaxID=496496 RepID=UPI00187B672F|nr:hypothetical protein [Viridibacillus sp. JNUCC-6]QOV12345.1 hypothetical protein JNUCC6_06190 [Viridibacillus sp. JNUCC-6]